jgi:hypothetical protein
MTQNTSSAVMQQRSEAHDSLDDFPTPPWATRALCEWVLGTARWPLGRICREPAANRGHMVRPLSEFFHQVDASDVHDYGAGFPQADYLFGPLPECVDWIITNPPFRLAEQFINRALETSAFGVAMFVRSAFLESEGRYVDLFSRTPPTDVLQFAERVVIHKGRLPNPNVKEPVLNKETGEVVMKKPTTATSYCWLVWIRGRMVVPPETRLHWIAPCRARLERPKDYPA